MPEPDGGLAGVGADTEHVELKLEIDVAEFAANRNIALNAELALLDREERLSVAAKQPFGGGYLGGAHRILPLRIDAMHVLSLIHI